MKRPASRRARDRVEPEAAREEWLVVLRADGVVDEVDGAPRAWLGRPLDHDAVPVRAREAAALLVSAPAHGYVRRTRLEAEVGGSAINLEILVVEALPLRVDHVRVEDLIVRTMEVFASQARSSEVELEAQRAPDVPRIVVADGEKIAWVLATLVGNALRYSGPRGRVRLGTAWDERAGEVVLTVSDDGPGMAPERARWLFERDPATGQAAGLALLMVRDVIAAHRGRISAVSALGRGTTFTVRLPRLPP